MRHRKKESYRGAHHVIFRPCTEYDHEECPYEGTVVGGGITYCACECHQFTPNVGGDDIRLR